MSVFDPVGIYRSAQTYRYETPRQGVFADNSGVIEFLPGKNYEEALRDLAGFDRIWIIFEFHLNATWRPKVRPPVSPDGQKIGVFATRSPHRPNRIGMSCVLLEKVEGLRVYVRNSDLLDRTPVLDIKPYIPKADAFPDSRTGWLEKTHPDRWTVNLAPEAEAAAEFIRSRSGLDLGNFARVQLMLDPLSPERKRLHKEDADSYSIGCRTWRLLFRADTDSQKIDVFGVRSSYSEKELMPDAEDKYGDKELHRAFRLAFGSDLVISQDRSK